jgi:hypothetical protein
MRRIGSGGFVLVSFCYLVLRRLLQLAALRVRSNDFKELVRGVNYFCRPADLIIAAQADSDRQD